MFSMRFCLLFLDIKNDILMGRNPNKKGFNFLSRFSRFHA